MTKNKLEQFNDKSQDFLYWIKSYVAEKIYRLKPNKGVKDFNREINYNLILNSSTIEELRENSNKVAQKMSGLRSYSTPLVALYNYVVNDKKIITLKRIDTNYIHSYTRKNKVSSNYYVQLRSLFKFIDSNILDDFKFDIGYLKDGTKAKLPVKMTKEKTFNFLEPKDFEKFVLSIKNYKTNHPNPYLLKLMVKFFCFGGFRAEEVQHIKQEDISFKELEGRKYLQVYILGKGSKERFVYILYDLIKEEYEKYQEIKKDKEHKCEYFFYSRDFKMFSSKRIYDIIKDFYKKSGAEIDNFSCHTLRRTYATILHFLGVPQNIISILLGHTSEETAEFYIFAVEEKSREVPSLFKF
jgi:integrase